MLKLLISIIIYILIPVFFYLFLACIGLIWFKWTEIMHSELYNSLYWLLVGTWIGIPFAIEYYDS